MNIPAVGGARGIFELFLPGAFLLLNLMGIAYYVPVLNKSVENIVSIGRGNPVPATISIICIGYLLGVLLRLLQVEPVDKLSAFSRRLTFWIWYPPRRLWSLWRKEQVPCQEPPLWTRERFPYIALLGVACKDRFPAEAKDFYEAIWWPKSYEENSKKYNKIFFNFLKILVGSLNREAAAEAYAEEALRRYIAGMFYSLLISVALIAVLWALLASQAMPFPLKWILLIYIPAICTILRFYRFLRIKETQALFAESFANRKKLEKLLLSRNDGGKSDR